MNIGLDRPKQKGLNCVIGDVTGDNSDTDSVAELEYNTWNDACAWEFRSASGNLPPGYEIRVVTRMMMNLRKDLDMGDM